MSNMAKRQGKIRSEKGPLDLTLAAMIPDCREWKSELNRKGRIVDDKQRQFFAKMCCVYMRKNKMEQWVQIFT